VNGVQILLVVAAGIAVSAWARRRGLQPGVIIVALAAAASFIPGVPRLELSSELILAIVVPPLLYSATRGVSFSSFGANLEPILALGVSLVLATTGALGLFASWMLPSIGLAAAFTLGAVLAPPDTITSVSHGGEFGFPRRVTAILSGESLVNDATALTLFSIGVGAVAGEHTGIGGGVLAFLRNMVLGILIGGVFTVVTLWIRKRLGNSTLETALALLVPFAAYLASEQAGASGIIAVVTASFGINVNLTLDPKHQYPGAYRTRLQEDALWPVVDFLLETFVFAYIGLQLKFVVKDLAESADPGLGRTLAAAAVLLTAAIVLRMAGAFGFLGWWRLRWAYITWMVSRHPERQDEIRRRRERRGGEPLAPPTAKETVLVGWTGMRGILTLAAAAAIPEKFPGRNAIQAIALFVTLGTLLIQGTTLRVVTRRLRFDLTGESAEAAQMTDRGRQIMAAVPGDTDDAFDGQRLALGKAVRDRQLDEETARTLIEDVDLRQAARHTIPEG
jgi:CPA1 family monovalent cation:H+ antiporter